MFESIDMAPPDPILGLTEAFNQDENPEKVNLGVGVYKDASGKTPVLASVKEAESRILKEEQSKGYLPMSGSPAYAAEVQQLMYGADHEAISSGRAATAHTPGGTGALRVAGDYIHHTHPDSAIWLPDPTWANHKGIFTAAGVETKSYAYFEAAANAVNFDAMQAALAEIPAGDVVLLHGCCQNPTGADLSVDQWNTVADIVNERGLLPLLDFAYQGFADGLDEDASGARVMTREGSELLICSSFSKNFSLYNERVGALTAIAADADTASRVMSHIKLRIRTNYSNPPAHGAAIVATILSDVALREKWLEELTCMRDRINGMRGLFVDALAAKGVRQDFSFIKGQRGMFSFSGLNKEQVERLRSEYAIYIVGSGRINVAGMTEANMDRLCEAIAAVL
jgi:aspartate/tyrosine/aromatic aminotransferase